MSLFVPVAALRTATVAVPFISPPIEAEAGDIIHFGLLLEALVGAPAAASFALKWQGTPIEANGLNINAETDGVARPWIDIASGDGRLGHMLLDGDFPASLADQTYPRTATGNSSPYPAGTIGIERRLRAASFFKQYRVVGTPTFNGGAAPAWILNASFSVQAHFGA